MSIDVYNISSNTRIYSYILTYILIYARITAKTSFAKKISREKIEKKF